MYVCANAISADFLNMADQLTGKDKPLLRLVNYQIQPDSCFLKSNE
jgi:hypothetical protein